LPIVLKSGSLNLLEPLGPLQACNGIALRFFILFILSSFFSFSPYLMYSVPIVVKRTSQWIFLSLSTRGHWM